MDMMELNRNTLNQIWMMYPTSVKDIKLEGNYLVYGGEMIDISNFDISRLLYEVPGFKESLSVLAPEDFFKIIKLHVSLLNKTKEVSNEGKNISKEIEVIKVENPLLKNITTVNRNNGLGIDEYINIVDSTGNDHLFKIGDKDFDFLMFYEELRTTHKEEITPEDLIHYINYKLREVQMDKENHFKERDNVTEDFANKMDKVGKNYRDNSTVAVMGNEKEDIAIVKNGDNHEIKTFEYDQNGDLIINSHEQNVNGIDTITKEGNESSVASNNQVDNEENEKVTESSNEISPDKKEESIQILIPLDDFKKLFDANITMDFSEEERKNVDLWYAYLGYLLLYEDYLLPELKDILDNLRNFIIEIECSVETEESLTSRQAELVKKKNELQKNKQQVLTEGNQMEKVEERIKKLRLQYPSDTGSITTLQVIAIIVGIAIILTAVTLYIIG